MARQPDPAVRSRWQSLIELQPQSGMTVTDFCDAHGVATASFYQWRRKLAQQPPPDSAFLPVHVTEESTNSASPIRIRFACGAVAEIPTEDQRSLVAVVDQLLAAGEPRQ
jgi:hypothetical protein